MLTLCVAAAAVALSAGLANRELGGSLRLLLAVAVPALLSPLFGANAAGLQLVPSRALGWACSTALLAAASWLGAGELPLDRLLAPTLVALAIVLVAALAQVVLVRVLAAGGIAAATATEAACWLVTATLWLLAAAPLWLGPVADLAAKSGPAAAEAVVAASPLVHLAVAAGQDLLRTEWFYAHSSLGSLQFDYPPLAVIAMGYTLVTVVLALLALVLSRGNAATAPIRRALPT